MTYRLLVGLISGVLGIAGLAQARGPGPSNRPYRITCTTGMVSDIVRAVAGDQAVVEGLIGEGVDPHLYNATRGDIRKLLDADIVFYSGLMLEGKMADALIKVARKRSVHAVTEMLDPSRLLQPPEFEGHHDPHLWMDVGLWTQSTERVCRALCEFDSGNADTYQANFKRYAAELAALEDYARRTLATIPESGRVLVTAHDAFNYMARAYDLEVIGIQGISTESEAGIEDINRIVRTMAERGIKAVFVETSVSDKNVRALVEGAAARNHTVLIGGSLFSDAMGQPGTYEGTYIGMIDHNVTTITRALGGEAPARGLNGKLGL